MLDILVLSNIPTPYNDALYRRVAREPGVRLHVAYCAGIESNRSWKLDGDKGYSHAILPGFTLPGSVHLNRGVRAMLREHDPDVVVLTGWYALPAVQLAAATLRARGIPWLFWGEALQLDRNGPLRSGLRDALRWVVRGSQGVLAIGRRAAESYAGIGVQPERITRFHYYPDADAFRVSAADRERARASIRAQWELPADAPMLLFCAQLIHRKGGDVLLHAVARLRRRGVPFSLLFAGDGPQADELAELTARLDLEDVTRFAGFVQPKELPAYFAAADALVLPSRYEGWGIVVTEAMVAGLPVVASDQVNAAFDLVRESGAGLVVPTEDVEALATALQRVCEDPVARERMAIAGVERAADESPERAATRFVRLLDAARAGHFVGAM